MALSIFVSSPETGSMIFARALEFEFVWRKFHELHAVVIFTSSYCCLHSCLKQSILLLRKKKGFYFCFVQHRKCC